MDEETLYRYVACRLSAEEEQAVLDWLAADPVRERELNRMQCLHDAAALSAPLVNTVYERDRSRSRRMLRLAQRWGMSAAALVLLALGMHYYRVADRYARQVGEHVEMTVPNGQHIGMKLADGTRVWLNAGTTLEYPLLFDGKERRVRLAGEARFEVVHDAKHPFVVETFACDVEVLGTEFNVVADRAENTFSAALFRGRVAVSSRLVPGDRVVLEPDEVVHLNGERLQVGKIANADDYLWTEGIINLGGHSFAELIARYEKTFDVEVRTEGFEMPDTKFWWGKICIQDGVDNAFKALQVAYPFRYEFDPEKRTVTIYSK